MTYESAGGVDTSKDGERANADDIVVEQRGTGLIGFNGLLKVEIPGTTQGINSRCSLECAVSMRGKRTCRVCR